MRKTIAIIAILSIITLSFAGCRKPESSKNGDAVIPGCYTIEK